MSTYRGSIGHPWLHDGVKCDKCGIMPIYGHRYKCTRRPDYDVCTKCFAHEACDPNNAFVKIERHISSKPYQVRLIECAECRIAPIQGKRYRNKTREDHDLCEACFERSTGPQSRRDISSEYEVVDKLAIKGGCSQMHDDVYHFAKQCDECQETPVRGPCFTSVKNANFDLCAFCHDDKLQLGSIKRGDFIMTKEPKVNNVFHVTILSCLHCGMSPIYGPAFKTMKGSSRTVCLICYHHVAEEEQGRFTRIDPPRVLQAARYNPINPPQAQKVYNPSNSNGRAPASPVIGRTSATTPRSLTTSSWGSSDDSGPRGQPSNQHAPGRPAQSAAPGSQFQNAPGPQQQGTSGPGYVGQGYNQQGPPPPVAQNRGLPQQYGQPNYRQPPPRAGDRGQFPPPSPASYAQQTPYLPTGPAPANNFNFRPQNQYVNAWLKQMQQQQADLSRILGNPNNAANFMSLINGGGGNGGGGGADYSSLISGAGGAPDFNSLLAQGGGGLDLGSMMGGLGAGGAPDFTSLLSQGGGGLDLGSMMGGLGGGLGGLGGLGALGGLGGMLGMM